MLQVFDTGACSASLLHEVQLPPATQTTPMADNNSNSRRVTPQVGDDRAGPGQQL